MTANDFFTQTVADAVKEAIAPLVARIDTLERLLTTTGGERAADMLTREQVAARLKVRADGRTICSKRKTSRASRRRPVEALARAGC